MRYVRQVSGTRVAGWVSKTVDMFQLASQLKSRSFSLNNLLEV